MTICAGDVVMIRPEWCDRGDEDCGWIACDNEEKGRVTIAPVNTGLAIPPRQTVSVDMLTVPCPAIRAEGERR